jgi:hypothetical protein
MQPGVLIYECLLCKGLDESIHVPDITLILVCLANGHELPEEWYGVPVNRFDVHHCKDGRLGVTQIIGAKADHD